MWVTAVPGGDVLYTWDQSMAASVADGIIPPWFKGILQSDGGREVLYFLKGGKKRLKPPPGIPRAACWAHVRRKFFEGAKAGCSLCARLLKIINVLYRIEGHARALGLTPQERVLLRQRRPRQVVAGLSRRIGRTLAAGRPKSAVGQACTYTLGQWDGLKLYLDHGVVEIDNNSVENAIRPCALGKKNWLFIGDVKAGPRRAIFYSLMGSCLRRGLNPPGLSPLALHPHRHRGHPRPGDPDPRRLRRVHQARAGCGPSRLTRTNWQHPTADPPATPRALVKGLR